MWNDPQASRLFHQELRQDTGSSLNSNTIQMKTQQQLQEIMNITPIVETKSIPSYFVILTEDYTS